MFTRSIVGFSVLALALIAMPTATAQDQPTRVQAALIAFSQPTRVCGRFLMGNYIVVHDDGKMARGEDCTTIYRLSPSQRAEEIVSFHCVPRQRPHATNTVVKVQRAMGSASPSLLDLVEYQFAGDTEAHGVPIKW